MKAEIYIPFNSDRDTEDYSNFYQKPNSYLEALHQYSMCESDEMKIKHKENIVSYAKCNCVLYDGEGEEMDIDKLVSLYSKSKTDLVFELDFTSADEDFLTEFEQWVDEHNRLKKQPEDIRLRAEKRIDFKLIVKNKQNMDTYCTFNNTLLLDVIDNEHFYVLVDKVIFTQNF
jgi:hypothetical protein